MWVHGTWFAETWFHHLVETLCFIDDREEELKQWRWSQLRDERRYYALGVGSPYYWTFGIDKRFEGEIASAYAEKAYQLGYLTDLPTINENRWKEILEKIPEIVVSDRKPEEILHFCGEPSLKSTLWGGQVWMYVPADQSGRWLFFDFAVDQDGYDEMLPENKIEWRNFLKLRDVRLPVPDFYSALAPTPYGKKIISKCITPDSKYPREKLDTKNNPTPKNPSRPYSPSHAPPPACGVTDLRY